MNLYFAGAINAFGDMVMEEGGDFLFSFVDKTQIRNFWEKYPDKKIFLDSGAFGVFSSKAKVNLDEYCQYCKENEFRLDVYAALDVIGDHKATAENIKIMEDKGLKPLPTFHRGSPQIVLEEMVEKYDYIALGGVVAFAKSRAIMQSFLDSCFSIIKDKCKVHGFGIMALWAWDRYPFYSVDATSWLTGGKFRRIVKFDGGKFETFGKTGGRNRETAKCLTSWHLELNRQNVREYLKAKDFYTRVWEKRGIRWEKP